MIEDRHTTLRLGRWLARLKLTGRFWQVLLLVTLCNCCVSVGINVGLYLVLWPDSMAEEWITMIFAPIGITVILTVPVIYMDFALVTALMRHRDDLVEQVRRDFLTGVASRSFFERHLRSVALSKSSCGALLIADIDHFKTVNDTYGHSIGDAVLSRVGAALGATVRSGDVVGRIGGEEFAIHLPDVDLPTAVHIAERLRKAVSSVAIEVTGAPNPLRVTMSIGLLCFESPCPFDELYASADAALYAAKDAGRDRLVVAPALLAA